MIGRALPRGDDGTGERLATTLAAQADDLRARLRRHRTAAAAASLLLAGGGIAFWFSSPAVRRGIAAAVTADPRLLLTAAAGFACSLAATALGWRLAFGALGARIPALDACARYAAGSIVNTLLPARLGDAARATLFGRALPTREGRVLTTAGALGAMALSRAVAHALAIACAAVAGVVPLWPVAAASAALVVAAAVLAVLHRHRGGERVRRLTRAAVVLSRQPLLGLGLLGWSLLAVLARVIAAAAVAAAVGLPSPFLAALAITAALDVAAALPVTPGGLGITSGAISLALAARGVALPAALAAGLVFHAVETLATFGFAALVLPSAVRPGAPARLVPKLGTAAVAMALAAAGASIVLDLA